MAKRSSRRLSKKDLIGLHKQREPIYNKEGKTIGSRLARDENGNVIWVYNGEHFPTLRNVVARYHINLLQEL